LNKYKLASKLHVSKILILKSEKKNPAQHKFAPSHAIAELSFERVKTNSTHKA
jgi:hypothetical protein